MIVVLYKVPLARIHTRSATNTAVKLESARIPHARGYRDSREHMVSIGLLYKDLFCNCGFWKAQVNQEYYNAWVHIALAVYSWMGSNIYKEFH